jgi:hypothetical protein
MRLAGNSFEVSRSVHCLWREPRAGDGYSTAVSLHSHTMHSREGLTFVPRVLRRLPLAYAALQKLEERHRCATGKPIPFEYHLARPKNQLTRRAACDDRTTIRRGLPLHVIDLYRVRCCTL